MRSEFEKKLKCKELLSELTFCEETKSYVGDILPTNLATINGAYWAWEKRQAEVDDLQSKLTQAYEDIETFTTAHQRECEFKAQFAKEKDELQKLVDAFKDHAAMLREAAKSHVYTEREQNILLSQADDIDKILGLEQALKGGGE